MPPNPFLLAADDSHQLLPLLRADTSLAGQQDEHGYSLVHAAASYNRLDLLRALVTEFGVPIDLRDEDAETALFAVETVEAARCLVEELRLDAGIQNEDGQTARQKLEAEGDFPAVVEYLKSVEGGRSGGADTVNGVAPELPPVPEGLSVSVGTMAEQEAATEEPDPAFRQRIEELAAREDFHTTRGQAELRQLVQDAIADQSLAGDRNVRSRQG